MPWKYSILFDKLKCNEETDYEWRGDEMFAYLIAARFGQAEGENISIRVTRTKDLGSYRTGQTKWHKGLRLYGIDEGQEAINIDGAVDRTRFRLFYILLVEEDETLSVQWGLFEATVRAEILEHIRSAQRAIDPANLPVTGDGILPIWRKKLIEDVTNTIDARARMAVNGPGNADDIVGLGRLSVGPKDLKASRGGSRAKKVTVKGDGGSYTAGFTIFGRPL